jgi:hypothetical protein
MILGEELLALSQRQNVLSMLPFAAQRFDPRINWRNGDKIAPQRRNQVAAMECAALIVVKGAKFATAAVRKFRHFGRRIFWFTNGRLVEVEIHPRVSEGLARLPKCGTWEPDLWAEQAEERRRLMQDLPGRTPDAIPTFGWVEVFNEDEIDCSADDIFKRCRRSKLAEL